MLKPQSRYHQRQCADCGHHRARSVLTRDAQRAKQEAAAVATTGGRTLGEMVYVSVDTFEPPRPMPMAYAKMSAGVMAQAAPTEEFSAQKITVTAHVNVMFALK